MGCLEMDLNASGVKELLGITWERTLGGSRQYSLGSAGKVSIGTQLEVMCYLWLYSCLSHCSNEPDNLTSMLIILEKNLGFCVGFLIMGLICPMLHWAFFMT